MQHITATDLDLLIQAANEAENIALIDVREPWEFKLCSIEGSTLIPMSKIPEAVNQLDPDKQTIVICHTGIRSQRVCMYLEQSGFENVFNLTGGVHAWATQVDETMATY